jgi:cytochrome c2
MRSAGLASLWIAVQLAVPAGIAVAAPAAVPAPAAQAQPPASPAMPAAPVSAPIVGHADAGSHLYGAICVYCHHLDETVSDVGAPGLKDAIEEHGMAWVGGWLADPQGFAEHDAKARALIAANPFGLVMPRLPSMQDAQNRADVIAFLKALGTADAKDEAATQ